MTKSFQIFLKLNKTKFANQYVVIVDKKLIANGKDIVSMLKSVRKKYPRKTPFIAKIPDKSLLVLWLNFIIEKNPPQLVVQF